MSPRGEVDLRRRQFDRAVTYARYWAGGVAGQRRGGIAHATSFKTDIVPLFTSVDIEHMSRLEVPLDDYGYMSQPDNAAGVYHQVSNGTMPPSASGEQPWSEDKVQLFKQWMDGGYAP